MRSGRTSCFLKLVFQQFSNAVSLVMSLANISIYFIDACINSLVPIIALKYLDIMMPPVCYNNIPVSGDSNPGWLAKHSAIFALRTVTQFL